MQEVTDSSWIGFVVAVWVALLLVGFLAYARGRPGTDGRLPAYDGEPIVVVVED